MLDLIDERGGLVEFEPGHYVSNSEALALTNFPEINDRRVIPVFSEEGFRIWRAALPVFAMKLCLRVPEKNIAIHHALFALAGITTNPAASERKNEWLNRMYDELYRTFPKAMRLRVSDENFRADPDSKWGASPFHYTRAYYDELGDRLLMMAAGE